MMCRFSYLIIFLVCFLTIVASCKNEVVDKEYFVIGEHYKKSIRNNSQPLSIPPMPIDFYGRNNILLTDSAVFMHIRPMRLFPGCGTGLSHDKIERIDLREDEIIYIGNVIEVLDLLKLDEEYGLVDIASVDDTIRNPFFEILLKELSVKKMDLVRVRTFSEEERWLIKSISEGNSYNKDSINWDLIPKLDVLIDLDNDGKFEIHESLN